MGFNPRFIFLVCLSWHVLLLQTVSGNDEIFNGRRYFFGSTNKTWQGAENDCIGRGGHLTSVHSKAENDFLTQQIVSRGVVSNWYGGIRVNNIFTWSDKTPFTTTFWGPGEPNGLLGEDCLHMNADHIGQWNDLPCNVEFPYVCKLGRANNLPLKNCKLDLGALLDDSGSIGSETKFRKETNFIKSLAKDLTIGPSNTRVSVIKFSTNARLEFKFNDIEGQNRTALYNALDGLSWYGGGTATVDALELAQKEMFSEANGQRKNVSKVLLVVTDGHSNSGVQAVQRASDVLSKQGVNIIPIGVGNANQFELEAMATNKSNVFYVNNLSELENAVWGIQEAKCTPIKCHYKKCIYSSWSSWSATCGLIADRSRSLTRSEDAVEERFGGCAGLPTTCENREIETITLNSCPYTTAAPPTQTQPTPTQTEPTPTQTEPTPTQTEPTPTQTQPTPPSLVKWGSNEYYFSDVKVTWFEAERLCIARGGTLATILSLEEDDFMLDQLTRRKPFNERTISYWLDGVKRNMKYVWNDGSGMIYKNLGGGRADEDSYTEGCVSVMYGPGFLVPEPYSWLKGSCTNDGYPIQYVCKGKNLNDSPTITTTTTIAPTTPSQPLPSLVTWGAMQYFFSDEKLNWSESQQKCTDLGGTLATIFSQDEDDFIRGQLRDRKSPSDRSINYWLDGIKKDMKYVWNDGLEMIYTNLRSGRTNENNFKEGCVSVGYSPTGTIPVYSWWTNDCADERFPIQYICKGEDLEKPSKSAVLKFLESTTGIAVIAAVVLIILLIIILVIAKKRGCCRSLCSCCNKNTNGIESGIDNMAMK